MEKNKSLRAYSSRVRNKVSSKTSIPQLTLRTLISYVEEYVRLLAEDDRQQLLRLNEITTGFIVPEARSLHWALEELGGMSRQGIVQSIRNVIATLEFIKSPGCADVKIHVRAVLAEIDRIEARLENNPPVCPVNQQNADENRSSSENANSSVSSGSVVDLLLAPPSSTGSEEAAQSASDLSRSELETSEGPGIGSAHTPPTPECYGNIGDGRSSSSNSNS